MMIWLVLLVLLILLLLLPVGIFAEFDAVGLRVKLIVGLFRIRLYPRKKQDKVKKNTEKSERFEGAKTSEKKSGGSFEAFMSALQLVLDILKDLREKIWINNLVFNLTLAGDDPSDLSVNYGRCCGALGAAIPQIERLFYIKKRQLEVQCDYTADKPTVTALIDITIPVYKLLLLCCFHGVRVLKKYREYINKTKAVQ